MARRLGHLARERMLTAGELEIFGEPYDRVSMLEQMSMGPPGWISPTDGWLRTPRRKSVAAALLTANHSSGPVSSGRVPPTLTNEL